jgi:hypothetical protein
MSDVTYRIRDWASHFENNRTRDLKRMDWVPMPNRMDGDGYTELVDHPNGAAHLGAWLAIVEIASRCEVRGTLLRDGRTLLRESRTFLRDGRTLLRDGAERAERPHNPQSLARISHLPAELFEEALPRLVDIGWLEIVDAQVVDDKGVCEIPQEGAAKPQEGAAIPQEGAVLTRARGTERNGTEVNRVCTAAPVVEQATNEDAAEVERLSVAVFGSMPAAAGEWLKIYPVGWITRAIVETEGRAKSPSYTAGILRRYQRDGGPGDENHDSRNNGKAYRRSDGDARSQTNRRLAERFKGIK